MVSQSVRDSERYVRLSQRPEAPMALLHHFYSRLRTALSLGTKISDGTMGGVVVYLSCCGCRHRWFYASMGA